MADYISFYDVDARKVDSFKCTYFLGYEVLEFLRHKDNNSTTMRVSDIILNRVLCSLTLFYAMDKLLTNACNMRVQHSMRKKILLTLSDVRGYLKYGYYEHPWHEMYGSYGIYMIFKNIYRFCDCCENTPTINLECCQQEHDIRNDGLHHLS